MIISSTPAEKMILRKSQWLSASTPLSPYVRTYSSWAWQLPTQSNILAFT
jgi:hypothetical protein